MEHFNERKPPFTSLEFIGIDYVTKAHREGEAGAAYLDSEKHRGFKTCMCHYQIQQINDWNRWCICLSKTGRRNLLDYRHVGGSPTKDRSVLLATAGSTGCSGRDLWLITTVPGELSAVINVFCEKPQALASLLCAAAFLKWCTPFCAVMAKASLLSVWTMECLWRQTSSVSVAWGWAKTSPGF